MSGENAKKHSNRSFWDKKMIQGKDGEEITAGQLENAKFGEIWNGYKQHEEKNAPDTGAVI